MGCYIHQLLRTVGGSAMSHNFDLGNESQIGFDLTVFSIQANAEALAGAGDKAIVGESELKTLAESALLIMSFIKKHGKAMNE